MNAMRIVILSILLSLSWQLGADDAGILTLTLDQARARAEDNSSDLRALTLQNLAQNYAYQLNIRAFFPTLSVDFNQSDAVTLLSPGDSTKKTFSLSLHQPLFDGGRSLFQRKVQKIELTLQAYNLLKKREELLDLTWSLFYQILLAEEKRRLQDEQYGIAGRQLLIGRKERELGLATEIDYLDTELAVKKLEADRRKTKTDEEVLVYQFQTLCGLPRTQTVSLDGRIDFDYGGLTIDASPDYWIGIALDRNMEYRQLQFQVQKSTEEYRIAQTAYIPTVGADFTFSLSGESFPLYEPGFNVKLTFQFPFNEAPVKTGFSGGLTGVNQRTMSADLSADVLPSLTYLSDQRLALIKIQAAHLQVDSAEGTLRFNIDQFLKNYQYEVDNLILQKETLLLLGRKMRVTNEQMGIGEIKRIDYLKAQNDYYQQSIGIRESILKIISLERGFEQLLGLNAGELAQYLNKPKTPVGVPQGVVP